MKKEMLSKKEPESEKIWKVLSLLFLQKHEEEHSRDNIKGTAKQSLDEEMADVSSGFSQPRPQSPGKGHSGGRLLNF